VSLADFRRMVDVGPTGWLTLEMLDPHRPAPITLCTSDGAGGAARAELTVDEARALFDALASCLAATTAALAVEHAAPRREVG
jgi:hypothetical protein